MSRLSKGKIISKELPPLPAKTNDYLYKIHGTALSNEKFRWGIDIIEKYYSQYSFSDNREYSLGLLYDHLAMRTTNKLLKKKYLDKAVLIYKKILKRSPRYFLAEYGIGRVYSILGNFQKAIHHQTKAYKEMLKYPKKQRGAMAISRLFEKIGDNKKAEQWYLKEYRDCKKSDFGTTLNLLGFYRRMENYDKALNYALKMEKLIKSEFKNKAYKGLKMTNSKFVSFIKDEIRAIKSLAQKKEVHG